MTLSCCIVMQSLIGHFDLDPNRVFDIVSSNDLPFAFEDFSGEVRIV